MVENLQDDGERSGSPGAEGPLPLWSARPVTDTQSDDGALPADQWIRVAEGEDRARQDRSASGAWPSAGTADDLTVQARQVNMASATPGDRYRQLLHRRSPMALLGILAGLAVAGVIGWTIGRTSSPPIQTDGTVVATAEDASSDDTDSDEVISSALTTVVTGSTAVPSTAGPTSTTVAATAGPFVVPDTPDNPSKAAQYAVMAGDKAVMRGWYPNEEEAESAVADAAVIMGGIENVIDETQVDERVEIRPDSFAVYLQDFVLFESDSAEITPEFYEFLGFPLFFMQNNPSATVTVVARTDARGTEAYNLELSTRRAEAVRDHWLANGGNADQIILDPRGEEDADTDADAEQAALDRRVELEVSGFLTG